MVQCQVCGHENPETNKFCGECAASLAAAERSSEVRKTVTIVFCDVAGSTAMGEVLDPESLRRVMGRFFDAMRAAIEHHGGIVEKFIGDAVMAVFGVPQVHEDDALRAVRAAADMRAALTALNADLDRDHGMTLACRIGVNTGQVVAGVGDQKIVTGDAVNVAARLEQAAASGEILLGEDTFVLVRDAVLAEPIEALNAKGKTDPVPAFRLIEVTPGAAGFARHLDAPIVGRQRELSLLLSTFERTVTDQACQLFTVLGVGGVGKSRLLAAFVEELGDRAIVLRGRCLPYGEGITFWPLAEALLDVADLDEADTPQAARAKLAALVGAGELAERVAERVGQAIGIPGSETAPEEMLWAIRVFLERLAAERPLVFMIDDLQWAEPKFLELVEHVSDLARDAPILLACMARPELLDDHPGWAGGKLNATSILLEPLGPEECGTLVANLLADDTVDEAVRTRIAEAAEGHPLYAEEITGLLVDEGRLVLKEGRWVATGDLSDMPVPSTISALLAARLDKLPSPERRVLDIASVMGQVFYSGAVRELASDDPATIDVELASLVRKQFVRPERSDLPGTEALAFRHLLIRDAAYDAIPKATRAGLHARLADWLDEAAGTLGEQDEILGYHLEQAYRYRTELGPVGEGDRQLSEKAGRRLASAGGRAFARSDIPASVNLLSRAVALLAPADPSRPGIMSDLGGALAESGDLEGARGILEEALERAEAAGDDRLRAHAAMQRWLVLGEGDVTETRREAERALEVFETAGDERGLSRAFRVLSNLDFGAGQAGASERALERALVHARNAGDAGEQAAIYAELSVILVRGPTPVGEGIRRCEEVLEETHGNRTIAAEMFHAMAHLRARRGEFDEALGLAERCRKIHWENGATWAFWILAEISWDIKMLAGEPGDALEILTEGYEHLEQMGDTFPLLAAFLAQSLYAMGQFEAAQPRAELAAASEKPLARNSGKGVLAKVLARQGRLEEAELMAREAVASFEDTEFSIDHTTVLMDLAEVLRLAGRPDEAVSAIRDAIDLYERKEDIVSAAKARKLIEELARRS